MMYTREEIAILPIFMRRIISKRYLRHIPEQVCIYKVGDLTYMIIYLRRQGDFLPSGVYEKHIKMLSEAYGLSILIFVLVSLVDMGDTSRFDFTVDSNLLTTGELKPID